MMYSKIINKQIASFKSEKNMLVIFNLRQSGVLPAAVMGGRLEIIVHAQLLY